MQSTYFVCLGVIFCLISCNPSPSSSTSEASAASKTKHIVCDPGVFDLEHNRITDSTAFPFVYQGTDNTLYYAAYEVIFSLSHDVPLYPLTNKDVPWIDGDRYSEENGNFITYVRNGRDLSLQNPYIMVQYIKKGNELTNSPEAVYNWLDSVMTLTPGSQIGKFYALPTSSGKDALCREYVVAASSNSPNPYDNRPGKQVAYAYMDFNDTYMIGMTLTCGIKTDFDLTLPLFQSLVQSMCF